jgi:glycine dehydrogenase subunit 1
MTWTPTTDTERREMLETIGVSSIDDLFRDIPGELCVKSLDLPPAMSEMAVRAHMQDLASKNTAGLVSFMGGGYYDHFIPAAVDQLTARGEYFTAYTPYQPEAAQGTLQTIYEYQSAIRRLTGMEYANASLYDGGTSVFEAATMSVRLTRKEKIVIHPSLNPRWRDMLATHAAHLELDIVVDDAADGVPDGTACVIAQNPAFDGTVADFTALAEACHARKALLVLSFYPISLGLLKTPAEMGADIAIAEGQSMGTPLNFGGPYLGVMATNGKNVRKMPGRIGAATEDAEGRRGFVLTLQAREQHIRRDKAMSNICSNEALIALRALIYLSLIGKEGLRDVATHCLSKAEYLKERLEGVGELRNDGPTFNEFVLRLPVDADAVVRAMTRRGFAPGLPLSCFEGWDDRDLLVAVTEKRTREELDRFAQALRDTVQALAPEPLAAAVR